MDPRLKIFPAITSMLNNKAVAWVHKYRYEGAEKIACWALYMARKSSEKITHSAEKDTCLLIKPDDVIHSEILEVISTSIKTTFKKCSKY
jgi:hypothetical protein